MGKVIYFSDKRCLGLEDSVKLTENYIFFLSLLFSWLVNSANLVPNISSFGKLLEALPRQNKPLDFLFSQARASILAASIALMMSARAGCFHSFGPV